MPLITILASASIPLLPQRLARTIPKPGDAAFTTLERKSVVAEMTPFTRHPNRTFSRVSALQGQRSQGCRSTDGG